MATAYVALGANMPSPRGGPAESVTAAFQALGDGRQMRMTAHSGLYRSAAWPDPRAPEFVNAVAKIETALSPDALLARLHAIEAEFGRVRRQPNAPRTLDLDIVDYDGRVSMLGQSPVLPHPRLAERAFVLLPLAEIAPHWRHPVSGVPIADLIAALPDPAAASAIAP